MIKKFGLAIRFAAPASALLVLASCSTTDYAKVQTVVPTAKPSADEIAMQSLQSTDTGATQTAALDLKPVDFATSPAMAMAYAVPTPKPMMDTVQAVKTASASVAPMVDAVPVPAIAAAPGLIASTTKAQQAASVSTAMLETKAKTRSLDPFSTATQNSDLNGLIAKYAAIYDVPVDLVHRVVRRESNYNPGALSKGNWGLMQIRYNTARGMGYTGTANGLLDAETNLKYAVKYLRGAWLVADGNGDSADMLYRTGYYYQAKAKGLLKETGLK